MQKNQLNWQGINIQFDQQVYPNQVIGPDHHIFNNGSRDQPTNFVLPGLGIKEFKCTNLFISILEHILELNHIDVNLLKVVNLRKTLGYLIQSFSDNLKSKACRQ